MKSKLQTEALIEDRE